MLSKIVLNHFLTDGLALSVLASQEYFLIENDFGEEQPDWTGGDDSDPFLRKENWKTAWERRVQRGLLAMKTVPPSDVLRRSELRNCIGKIAASSWLPQRQVVLCELAAFDGYWPTSLSEIQLRKLFVVTEFQQEFLNVVSKMLGFPEETGFQLLSEIDELWKHLCPKEFHPSKVEMELWPMTVMGRCLAAPFLKHHPMLIGEPQVREEPAKLIDSALASIGVGVVDARDEERGTLVGALGAGGVLLDEENPHSWNFFEALPFESQAFIAAKFQVFVKKFLGGPNVKQERQEITSRLLRLHERMRLLAEQAPDSSLQKKRQATHTLLANLETNLRV
ncbi:MAG: hypothetical protein WA705_10840 [Candidatus Ozemobacteraceae bacterium]